MLSPQQLSTFCPEALVVASKYQHDFEKFGIHLRDKQQRAKVAQLLALNQHFPALFNATLVSGAGVYELCCVLGAVCTPPWCGLSHSTRHVPVGYMPSSRWECVAATTGAAIHMLDTCLYP